MSLTEILEEVAKLSPAEKEKVLATLRVDMDGNTELSAHEKQEQLLQVMLRKGLLKRMPKRQNSPRKSRPVPIKGKPLSETIIEERR